MLKNVMSGKNGIFSPKDSIFLNCISQSLEKDLKTKLSVKPHEKVVDF